MTSIVMKSCWGGTIIRASRFEFPFQHSVLWATCAP
jgi:hypothetical protein